MEDFQTITENEIIIVNNTCICRACLNISDINNDLFNLNYENEILSHIFQKCTSIQIKENTPKHICKSCLSELVVCYHFIKKCETNNSKIEEELNNTKSTIKTESSDTYIEENSSGNEEIITLNIVNEESTPKNDNQTFTKSNKLTKYICKFCQETYSELSFLEAHELTHELDEIEEEVKTVGNPPETSQPSPAKEVPLKFYDDQNELPTILDNLINSTMKRCEICDKSFSTNRELNEHMKSNHKNEQIFTCSSCDKIFNNRKLLKIHLQSFHNISDCEVFGKHFELAFQLPNHTNDHTENLTVYPCNKCGKLFKWKISFQEHLCFKPIPLMTSTTKDTIDNEKRCDEKDSQIVVFKLDKEEGQEEDEITAIKHDFVPVKTKEDNRRFAFDDNSPRPYKCTVCDKTFKQLAHFTNHQRTHTGAQPYKCTRCTRTFKYLASAKFHLKGTHRIKYEKGMNLIEKYSEEKLAYEKSDEPDEMVKCDICSLMLQQKSLRFHLMRHTGERNYMCEICGKTFIQKHLFDEHFIRHTNEKPYSCKECGRNFRAYSSLKEHILKHQTPTKTIRCDICEKLFLSKRALFRHQIVHNKRFLCSLCGRSFTNRTQLTEHTNRHLGLRPYRCNICHKGFAKKSEHKNHMYLHNENKPYVCTICNKSFIRRYRVAEHCLKVHGIDLKELKEIGEETAVEQE